MILVLDSTAIETLRPNELELRVHPTMPPPATDISMNASISKSKATVCSPKRITFAMLGFAFVTLGAIGVFLPGIPTVGPLLAASFFFTKSFPQLEKQLIRNRFFKPYLQLVDGDMPMPLKAKVISMVLMWASILTSCSLLCSRPNPAYGLPAVIVALGFVGTWFIAIFQRNKREYFDVDADSSSTGHEGHCEQN